jgi:hypothetical protein
MQAGATWSELSQGFTGLLKMAWIMYILGLASSDNYLWMTSAA